MVVSDAEEESVFELVEVFVLAEESLLPEHVDFVVDGVDDFFKGLVV